VLVWHAWCVQFLHVGETIFETWQELLIVLVGVPESLLETGELGLELFRGGIPCAVEDATFPTVAEFARIRNFGRFPELWRVRLQTNANRVRYSNAHEITSPLSCPPSCSEVPSPSRHRWFRGFVRERDRVRVGDEHCMLPSPRPSPQRPWKRRHVVGERGHKLRHGVLGELIS